MISCGKWRLIREVSCDHTSKVYFAESMETLEKRMVKTINNQYIDRLEEEDKHKIAIMTGLDHPNLIKTYDYEFEADIEDSSIRNEPHCLLVSETITVTKLFEIISFTGPFSEKISRYYFHQILDAIIYLSDQGINQLDLRADNLFLDNEYNLKIGDYTQALLRDYNKTIISTDVTQAPECSIYKENDKLSFECVNMFAIGVILFMMVVGKKPFVSSENNYSIYKTLNSIRSEKFWHKHLAEFPEKLQFLSLEIKELITLLLSHDPYERPSLTELTELEWYNESLPTGQEVKEEIYAKIRQLDDINVTIEEEFPDISDAQDIFYRIEYPYRGVYDEDIEEIEERICEAYIPEFKTYTQFFSTSEINTLFEALVVYANMLSSDIYYGKSTYSCTYHRIVEESEPSSLLITVNILSVEDDLHCVQVIKKSGCIFHFAKEYKEITKFFGGHCNQIPPTQPLFKDFG
ncbi:unnamed protein product [Moneuplotes crassus]|uniref:Protein kinase domain-containing protein n=1 Tax=Euplotes crassus TaxID=5936 RepID=A0AAD1UAC8_EUPCR|nr:unnamed protein product [Moneuplotes crassus]